MSGTAAEDPCDWPVSALLASYRSRSLSPVEVARAVIARIDRCEPHVRALYAYDPERVLDAARESEARWARGKAGLLDGVPATLKENIATRGTPMPLGTAARPLLPSDHDAPLAARLLEAGAVLVAKTTMPDFGMLSSGLSSFHPLTRNPWDLTRNPGGSSAGAAVAAALGYGPLHAGTDIGGSVRLPAGWCGVFAFKPTNGRVAIEHPFPGRVAGPITRRVDDAAWMMRAIARPDPLDPTALPASDIDWFAQPPSLRGLRLGLLLDAGFGLPVDPCVRAAVERAAALLAAEGAVVEPIGPFLTRAMIDGLDLFWRQRAWLDIEPLDMAGRARILPFILAWAEGGRNLTGAQVFGGMMQMSAMRHAAVAACSGFDAVLSPVAPVPAFAAELASPSDDPARPFEHIAFTVACNMSDQPAAAINCGYTPEGLPIGLQIIGPRFEDGRVMALSRAFEALREPQRPWPLPA